MSFNVMPLAGRAGLGTWIKAWGPLCLAPLFLWLLFSRLSDLDPQLVWQAFQQVTPWQWAVAALISAFGYAVVGQYDVLAHRLLGTFYAPAEATAVGASSIAIGQILGCSAVTSAFVRWRLLGGLSAAQVARLSAMVAICFLSGWVVIAAICVLMTPVAPQLKAAAIAVLALTLGFVALTIAVRSLNLAGRRIKLPSLRFMGRVFAITCIDLLAAAAVLAVLLPAEFQASFAVIFAAFTLALGAGLISNTPGGVGPFELTLLALLPLAPEAHLLAGVLAFRLVYYVLPALVATAYVLTRAPATEVPAPFEIAPRGAGHTDALLLARRAEAQIVRQGDGFVLSDLRMDQRLVCHQSSQCTVMLGDPVSGDAETAMALLQCAARRNMAAPLIYKCGDALATAARAARWWVTPIAEEAVLSPRSYDTTGSKRRQLRRKLRKASEAQVEVTHGARLPLDDMARVAAHWAARNGGERGVSTGRFEERYLARQRVYLAHVGKTLAGFVTFHVTDGEWTLDLIRTHGAAPDGIVHAMVHRALLDAAEREVPRLSLASLPYCGDAPGWQRRLRGLHNSGSGGLRQFKQSFAPDWEVLYAAAPTAMALGFGLFDVLRDIHFPPALTDQSHNETNNQHENLQFA